MKSLKEFLSETSGVVTRRELKSLRKSLEPIFMTAGIRLEFSNHFFQQINNPRDDIDLQDLYRIFVKFVSIYKDEIRAKAKRGFEAVIKDMSTAINIPVAVNWSDTKNMIVFVVKTIMKKINFRTRSKVLRVRTEGLNHEENSEYVFIVDSFDFCECLHYTRS